MMDLSWSHILLVLIVALVVVGPKDLPKVMRTLGQWMSKARQMADQFRASFDEMTRQGELDELRKELESLRAHRPFESIERDLNQSVLPSEFTRKPDDVPPPSVTPDRASEDHPTSS
jgi:sec-independent protein translocase protein TatB